MSSTTQGSVQTALLFMILPSFFLSSSCLKDVFPQNVFPQDVFPKDCILRATCVLSLSSDCRCPVFCPLLRAVLPVPCRILAEAAPWLSCLTAHG